MRAAVSARSVPCRPAHLFLHLLLPNIVILNKINVDEMQALSSVHCILFFSEHGVLLSSASANKIEHIHESYKQHLARKKLQYVQHNITLVVQLFEKHDFFNLNQMSNMHSPTHLLQL